jgi:hypothetical protein
VTRYSSHLRVAHEKGMLLADYLENVTHLEHEMWCVWYNRQWNEPDRGDWYTMALTAEVRQFRYGWTFKKPPVVNPKDMRLRFETGEDEDRGGMGGGHDGGHGGGGGLEDANPPADGEEGGDDVRP